MNTRATAYVGLGGNLGDAGATLRAALAELDALPDTRLDRASRLYRTPAWGIVDQPDFVNAVARLRTGLDPRTLLDELLAIERAHGRDRDAETRWGPRALDLDLLLHGQAQLDEPGLQLPHPHLHERAFVLVPLLEIAPAVTIPGIGRASDAAAAMADAGIQAIG